MTRQQLMPVETSGIPDDALLVLDSALDTFEQDSRKPALRELFQIDDADGFLDPHGYNCCFDRDAGTLRGSSSVRDSFADLHGQWKVTQIE
jgi:hypothetical protein